MSAVDAGAYMVPTDQENDPWNDAAILTAFDVAVKAYGKGSVARLLEAEEALPANGTNGGEAEMAEMAADVQNDVEKETQIEQNDPSVADNELEMEAAEDTSVTVAQPVTDSRAENGAGRGDGAGRAEKTATPKAKKRKLCVKSKSSKKRRGHGRELMVQGMPPMPPMPPLPAEGAG
eukprot:scaffold1088_cov247-Pinguiococcus_pyrenoidosus.AAC.1